MASKSPFEWLKDIIKEDDNIESIDIINENLMHIKRNNSTILRITKSSLNEYFRRDIENILKGNDVDFILHTVKEPFIDGSAFDYLDSKKKILGGFGDVIKVLGQDKNWPYLPKEVKFIKRGLEQHTKVSRVRRLDNKRYEISRYGLETVIIIALNDYDLGIDSIRSAAEEFDTFDAVLKSNPNGRITSSAVELIDTKNIKVLWWRELMGQLNLKWKKNY